VAQSTIETGREIKVDHIDGNTVDGEFDEGDFNEYNDLHTVQPGAAVLIDHLMGRESPMAQAASGAAANPHHLGLDHATAGAGIEGATNAVDKMQHNHGDIGHLMAPSNDGYTQF